MNKFLNSVTLAGGAVQAVTFSAIAAGDLPTTIPTSLGIGNSAAPNDASLFGGTNFLTGISLENTWFPNVANGTYENLCSLALIQGTPASNVNVINMDVEQGTAAGQSWNLNESLCIYVNNVHQGTGTINVFEGMEAHLNNINAGTITNGFGGAFEISNSGTWVNAYSLYTIVANFGTMTAAVGLFVDTNSNAGTLTANYGVYISNQSGVGTTSYNLYSAGVSAKHQLLGTLALGVVVASPTARLTCTVQTDAQQGIIVVAHSATQSGNLQEWQNNSGVAQSAVDSKGNLTTQAAGVGFKIKEGSNARMGTGTLSGGTATVSNTSVTANTRIFLSDQGGGVLANIGSLSVGTVTAGTSFVVNSSNALDSSKFAWLLIEPA